MGEGQRKLWRVIGDRGLTLVREVRTFTKGEKLMGTRLGRSNSGWEDKRHIYSNNKKKGKWDRMFLGNT